MKKHFLIVVIGPTCVGKTAVTLQLAQYFETEILSADARQMYKQLDIGTAKPDAAELAQAKHHFVDNLPLDANYNAGQFEKDALDLLAQLFEKHPTLLMTGGSGLYINAVCEGLDDFPKIPAEIQNKYKDAFEKNGIDFLQKEMSEKETDYFTKMSNSEKNNPQRLIRALAVLEATGQSILSFRKQTKKERPFNIIKIGLNRDRAELYERINKRVDLMLEAGLVEEVKSVLEFADLNALQTVGYRELIGHFNGEYDMDEAIRLIKRNTRRYAKRQLTWFGKDDQIQWFHPNEYDKIVDNIVTIIEGQITP